MLKQFPLKNYNDIHKEYSAVLASVEHKKASMLALQFEYQKEIEALNKLEQLRSNMHSVLDFLEKSKNADVQRAPIPSINLGSLKGHALAISKYVLKYPEEQVLIVTNNLEEFSTNSSVNCSVTKVHLNFSKAIRGKHYHRIILDSLYPEQTEVVLSSLPECLLSNTVIVGGSYGTTDD